MAVYVDDAFMAGDWGRWTGGGHLQADSPEELEAFARRLGLSRAWLQTRAGRPERAHYDLHGPRPHPRGRARCGAGELARRRAPPARRAPQWFRSALISSSLLMFERPSMPISPARFSRSSFVQSS
jgi:hypothetical protein